MTDYLEDLAVGDEFTTPGRTVTEHDIVAFAGLTGDYAAIHTNEVHAAASIHGRRIAHGLLGLAFAQGLTWRASSAEGARLASLGWDEWRFLEPIFIGDTIHVRCRVTSTRRSRTNPSRGVVVEELAVVNQHGEVVQCGLHTTLVPVRGAEA
ncbi:MaoC/PaaZ C-terminal domain-containing protein [Jiangella asiatica]|uniref:Dehydratase n=1 Tax=Jiangella asiatica TaxID=2530372 RepID=A0A4R5CP34_9ACTN|nr:MaoC/PaaZ C-terminal domain-containing protein [Jiangella asiatica]TDE01147.1 dehydratase [Jiangella asiatica]